MDKEYFLNAGFPSPLQPNPFEPSFASSWVTTPSAAPEQQLRCSSDQCSDWLNPAMDQYNTQFESALSSMVSSPAAPDSAVANDSVAVRELIGKLGSICSSGEISPHLLVSCSYTGNNSTVTSRYGRPSNSPPKLCMPKMNQFIKVNLPNLGNSVPLNSALPALSADPGFVERAAKFSCFGSRSFNGRANQFGMGSCEFPYNRPSGSSLMGCGKLSRVLSSPSLKADGSPFECKNAAQSQPEVRPANGSIAVPDQKFGKFPRSAANSNEESSVSEQFPSGATETKTPNQPNSRKRKGISRGKSKEDAAIQYANDAKGAEVDNSNAKRPKPTEAGGSENGGVKTEDEPKRTPNVAEEDGQKQAKPNQKPPETPKDYIHVRARRGQATDSHSLAERVRREKISERMKVLQDLVPGCNKVIGKALMLDEIINYVQSLQRQVEFLSMKLASVNPTMDINMESLLAKDHPLYPLDSSAPAFYEQKQRQTPRVHTNLTNGAVTQCSVDPSDAPQCHPLDVQLPPVNFVESLAQCPTFCEDDLQSIVQMGFTPNTNWNTAYDLPDFQGLNQTLEMKTEM